MSDGFDDYMAEMVDPTIADLEADPTNRRRGFLACVATFHGIDYLVSGMANAGRCESSPDGSRKRSRLWIG